MVESEASPPPSTSQANVLVLTCTSLTPLTRWLLRCICQDFVGPALRATQSEAICHANHLRGNQAQGACSHISTKQIPAFYLTEAINSQPSGIMMGPFCAKAKRGSKERGDIAIHPSSAATTPAPRFGSKTNGQISN